VTASTSAWSLIDDRPDTSAHARTVFALGNGFVGLRGTLEEDEDVADQGFVNGFYETWPIAYPEDAYGLARTGQTIQPAFNPSHFSLTVDGHRFDPSTAALRSYTRTLDLRRGRLTRDLVWLTPDGTAVTVHSSRLVSVAERSCVLLEYAVSVSAPANVVVNHWLTFPHVSTPAGDLDPRRSTAIADTIRLTHSGPGPVGLSAVARTTAAGIGVACTIEHQVDCPDTVWSRTTREAARLGRYFQVKLDRDRTLSVRVLAAFATDGPRLSDQAGPLTDDRLLDITRGTITEVSRRPWTALADDQTRACAAWWDAADIEVDAGHQTDQTQGAIRWNLFQVLQASACGQRRGIPAKGVTGSGYDGHTFWDADAMVVPVLAYTQPRLAREALSYRYATLGRARQRASELHQAGALFAWRTIDGREASAFFEAGTAQYHIDADIAYAVNRYLTATGDADYLATEGIDILVETARLWADLGFFDAAGVFHLHGVTGPDEYSAMVDDNLYTNVMAAANLTAAAAWLDRLYHRDHPAWLAANARLGLTDQEAGTWTRMAANVAIPFDETQQIHGQDAQFLTHRVWDFANTPAESYPLLLHFHPLTIYRHQVLKQADVVLAMINRPDLFTPAQMRANFDYYDPLTTGDSTLSASAQAIVAAAVGRLDLAEHYFRTNLATDLENSHGNSGDGIHIAAAASVWSTLVMGFGGLRDYGGIALDPCLPDGWRRLGFRLRLGDSQLGVAVTHEGVDLTLLSGDPVRLTVRGQEIQVTGTRHIG